jgi:hypothetical protein
MPGTNSYKTIMSNANNYKTMMPNTNDYKALKLYNYGVKHKQL